jgi:Flp pilus assembly protein TadD
MRIVAMIVALIVGTAAFAVPSAKQIDVLFASLAKANSEEEAKPIESQILVLFQQSGSPSVDLLMARAQAALQGGDTDTAAKLFKAVTDIAPDYAEGWHVRGVMLAAAGDDSGAMVLLQKVVALNPRQFEALGQLGGMLADYGDKKGALAAYRRALALDPQMAGVARTVRDLTRQVEGEKI